MEQVYCTMILTDGYLPGAQVLAHSLRDGGTTRKLAVIIPDEGLSQTTIRELERLYDYVIPVERIHNNSPENLILLGRLELGYTFTKIKLWSLVQFSKIVYVDADVLALGAPDELFDTEAPFAACPDAGWPDCFNSGVMVLNPDMGTYQALLNLARRGTSFDGADQGLLNIHFRSWYRIPFIYNVTPSASYQYTPAYRHYGSTVRMVHFIGADKPWLRGRSDGHDSSKPSSYGDLVSRWWATWDKHYRSLSEQNPLGTRRGFGIGGSMQHGFSAHFQSRPGEYDPNFRRDHSRHDNVGTTTRWQPPPIGGGNRGKMREHKEEGKSQHPYVPPLFLPREAVPYVPRETPYSTDSQTPESAHHQPHPVHGRFSVGDIQERADNALPLPPVLKSSEEKDAPQDQHYQPKSTFDAENAQTTTRFYGGDNVPSQEKGPFISPESPVIVSEDDWSNYSLVNAWDNDPEIHRYMESFQKFNQHSKRGNITPKPVFRVADLTVRDDAVEGEPDVVPPELPVTPNPVRSRGAWRSSELDDEEKFPSAKGIPNQQDWDPEQQLEELKNAPGQMLHKTPPTPSSTSLGSPRLPGEYRVSSSVPVPQLPHMITAYIEGHRRASLLDEQDHDSLIGSGGYPDFAPEAGQETLPPDTIRPTARRNSSTQTDPTHIVEEKGIQVANEELTKGDDSVVKKPAMTSNAATSTAV